MGIGNHHAASKLAHRRFGFDCCLWELIEQRHQLERWRRFGSDPDCEWANDNGFGHERLRRSHDGWHDHGQHEQQRLEHHRERYDERHD